MIVKKITPNYEIEKLYSNAYKIEHFKEFVRIYYLGVSDQETELQRKEELIHLKECHLEVLP